MPASPGCVRSLADAEQAARAHPTVTILCGAAVKLDPAEQFDLVVAADGVGRLNSTEGKQMTASELVQRLTEAVRPDGVLLLMHDNHFGLHHTVRLDPGTQKGKDSEWYQVDEHDTDRPGLPAAARRAPGRGGSGGGRGVRRLPGTVAAHRADR